MQIKTTYELKRAKTMALWKIPPNFKNLTIQQGLQSFTEKANLENIPLADLHLVSDAVFNSDKFTTKEKYIYCIWALTAVEELIKTASRTNQPFDSALYSYAFQNLPVESFNDLLRIFMNDSSTIRREWKKHDEELLGALANNYSLNPATTFKAINTIAATDITPYLEAAHEERALDFANLLYLKNTFALDGDGNSSQNSLRADPLFVTQATNWLVSKYFSEVAETITLHYLKNFTKNARWFYLHDDEGEDITF